MNDTIFKAAKIAEKELGGRIYLVGGAVRDHLLGKDSHDLDFVVIGRDYTEYAAHIAKQLRSHPIPFKDNIRVPYRGAYIDISAPRGDTIEDDLAKRDFTVNNLAMTLDGKIIGDRGDLDRGLIVPVYDRVFDDDPVRILRGFRQAASLGFLLSAEFIRLAEINMALLRTVAGERICEELRKLSLSEYATQELYEKADSMGLWREITSDKVDTGLIYAAHSVDTDDSGRFIIFIASMLYTASNPRAVLERLRVSKPVERGVLELLRNVDSFAADGDLQKAVWINRKGFVLLLDFIKIVRKPDESFIQNCGAIYRQIREYTGEYVTGGDITALAPDKPVGRWIADTIDKCNFMLTFGLAKDKAEALSQAQRAL